MGIFDIGSYAIVYAKKSVLPWKRDELVCTGATTFINIPGSALDDDIEIIESKGYPIKKVFTGNNS
jgi:hypothetical protein